MQVSFESERSVTPVAGAPPTVTVAPTRLAPDRVSVVPPESGPQAGVTAAIDGALRRTKTSAIPFVSPATRLLASDAKAITWPSSDVPQGTTGVEGVTLPAAP